MNLSDSDDSKSTDDQIPPAKRLRSDTVESSSNYSAPPDSEDDRNDDIDTKIFAHKQRQTITKRTVSYTDATKSSGNTSDSSKSDNSDDEPAIDYSSYSKHKKIMRHRISNDASSDSPDYQSHKPEYENNSAVNVAERESLTEASCALSSHTDNSEDEGHGRAAFGSYHSNDEASDWQSGHKSSSYIPDEKDSPTLESKNLMYSSTVRKMMKKYGYKEGEGLGKEGEGRVEPIEPSRQKGRRGLGNAPSELGPLPKDLKWEPEKEVVDIKEEVIFIPEAPDEPLHRRRLDSWCKKGPKKLTIDDETSFVEPSVLHRVLNAKSVFDKLDDEEMRKARFRSNPYETIGNVCFLNRAAVKMANMDAILDFIFTEPKDKNNKPILKSDELLYFADVCAGPGGFSEYVLFRKKWKAKGFGFTLKGANDFKLSDFLAGPPETFCPFYGEDEDGNIFKPHNLTSLKEFVLNNTDGHGVHFLMADGGFSVAGEENIQEIRSKQLYLCQCLAALMLVRTDGHFVVKLFDVFTPFTVGLIYIMYRCFDKVSIHKPVTSRPANSERYLICLNKRPECYDCELYLEEVNKYLWEHRDDPDADVTSLVSLDVLKSDVTFFNYIYNSNRVIGEKQILSLVKIAEFCKNPTLQETRQAEIKEACLKYWKLTDEVRKQPEKLSADAALSRILKSLKPPRAVIDMKNFYQNELSQPANKIRTEEDLNKLKIVFAHHFKFLASVKDCMFFMGTGGSSVYQLKEGKDKWESVPLKENSIITMPANTLVYGEIAFERTGVSLRQIWTQVFHIIDAVCLGGVPVSHMSILERQTQCEIFSKALDRIGRGGGCMKIRCKPLYPLENFKHVLQNLEIRKLKRGTEVVAVNLAEEFSDQIKFHELEAILFYKAIKTHWFAGWSKRHNKKYYHTLRNKICYSIFELNEENSLDALSAHKERLLWEWSPPIQVLQGANQGLTRHDMEHFIERTIRPQ